jgi:SAM-dependent methyltransferase
MSTQPIREVDEDDAFDCQLPRRLQMKSALHLTPAAIARQAARLLAPDPGMRVLDVGCGPGKFCVIAACEMPAATFVGVEIRPHLVKLARKLAGRLGVSNASFVAGDALQLDWADFDAFYFYNPFAEQLHDHSHLLDRRLELDPARFLDYVVGARERLAAARIGTRLVTYHGLGAPPPDGYDLVDTRFTGTEDLELWIKHRYPGLESTRGTR